MLWANKLSRVVDAKRCLPPWHSVHVFHPVARVLLRTKPLSLGKFRQRNEARGDTFSKIVYKTVNKCGQLCHPC